MSFHARAVNTDQFSIRIVYIILMSIELKNMLFTLYGAFIIPYYNIAMHKLIWTDNNIFFDRSRSFRLFIFIWRPFFSHHLFRLNCRGDLVLLATTVVRVNMNFKLLLPLALLLLGLCSCIVLASAGLFSPCICFCYFMRALGGSTVDTFPALTLIFFPLYADMIDCMESI